MKTKLIFVLAVVAAITICSLQNANAQANTTLSNLTSPTAVNVDLLPKGTNVKNFGSSGNQWKNLYLGGAVYFDGKRFISNAGTGNFFAGQEAGISNSGSNNTANGSQAFYSNTTGSGNTVTGFKAMYYNTTGSNNTANGSLALANNTTGQENTAMGNGALNVNISGSYNTGYGYSALLFNKGSNNTAVGRRSLYSNVTGSNNTAIGYNAGLNITDGSNNVCIGASSSVDFHVSNTVVIGSAVTSSQNNSIILGNGQKVGINTATPSFTLDVLGEAHFKSACSIEFCPPALLAEGSTGDAVNGLSIYRNGVAGFSTDGNGVYGNSANSNGVSAYSSSLDGLYAYTNNPGPRYAGYFDGDVITTGFYYGSDLKLKQNIHEVFSAISIINKLQPKQYEFRKDGNYKLMNLPQGNHYGLIAQDVEKILPNLVKDSKFETKWAKPNPSEEDIKNSETINFKALNYTELIPIIIKGMQEQETMIEKQQQQIDELKQMIEKLSGQVMNNNSSVEPFKSTSATITSATLEQNIPNPLTNTTTIRYNIPAGAKNAQIVVTDVNGKTIKQITVSSTGSGQINIDASALSNGTYNYSLIVDGKIIESKKMMIAK